MAGVQLATNRVRIEIAADHLGPDRLTVELVHAGGTLVARRSTPGWLPSLPADDQRLVRLALAGLDSLCGADFTGREAAGVVESAPVESLAWDEWRNAWEQARAGRPTH